MRIRTFNDPVLRRPASPIKRVTAATRRLAAQMVETMRGRGVGLAAPQVGESVRLIVVDTGGGLHVLVNPEITAESGRVTDWEGCLSFPGLLAEVERSERVTVAATGLDGKRLWVEGEGYFARALQHEIDHLDGVVFLDRAKTVERAERDETVEVEPGPDEVESGGAGAAPGSFVGSPEVPAAERPLRVAFLGTPDFALPTLENLVAAGHEVVGVVTQPDRPSGRGGRVTPSPVKRTALAFGLPVWQGTSREARASLAEVLARWQADVAVVVAYGVILPPDALRTPRFGCVNLHASLLPDYRGPAPIQRAIMDGRSLTGVSIIRMDEGVDTGDILAQREVAIRPDDTAGDLHDRLARVGANLVLHVLDLLGTGRAAPRPQPCGPAAPAPKLRPEDEVVDWRRPAVELARQVRALTPVPGAHTEFGGRRLKIWWAEVAETEVAGVGSGPVSGQGTQARHPGEVVGFDRGSPVVATGQGGLVVRYVQPAGGSRMRGPDFVNGYRVKIGDRFGGEG